MARASIAVKKVTATDLRDKLKTYLKEATANRVVLVENRRQPPKYLVDKDFLDSLVNERESMLATLEILADRELTDRLLTLSKTIDEDVAAGRLLTTADVFGKCAEAENSHRRLRHHHNRRTDNLPLNLGTRRTLQRTSKLSTAASVINCERFWRRSSPLILRDMDCRCAARWPAIGS